MIKGVEFTLEYVVSLNDSDSDSDSELDFSSFDFDDTKGRGFKISTPN